MIDYLAWLRDPLLIEVDRKLSLILDRQETLMSAIQDSFDALIAQVAQTAAGQQSAVAMISGLVARLEESSFDPAQVRALTAQLASAVVAVPPPPQP